MLAGFIPPILLAANQAAQIYAGPPAGMIGMVNVLLCNLGGGVAQASIAVSKAANAAGIASGEWVTFNRRLSANGEFEKTMLAVVPGERVYVRSSVASVVTARAHGYERIGSGAAVSVAPNANAISLLYTAPLDKSASGNVLVVNRSNQVVALSLAITSAAANAIPGGAWIASNRQLPDAGEYEKCGLTVQPGESVYCRSNTADLSFRAAFALGVL